MRLFLLGLLLLRPLAAEPLDLALPGPVKIEKATYYLNGDRTGGSVAVILMDAEGRSHDVHYMTADFPPEEGGGKLSIRRKPSDKDESFEKGSKEEARLLKLLRAACIETYGSADVARLREGKGRGDAMHGFAMSCLLHHFPEKGK
ncbi:hypothetical protein OJ996_23605 [Luteolibacter sp. GHJ8]|uniref:Uncharacterized protein n=1 Tax=Luteolibacter rhizosphaerae TaxID=2989719 RepID=A0ABT3G9S2_9BACT|nr:hypothetical protein [Luteolibacter rhizosphaerae]MCW1916594.1 hypothetical protein [Luteolibacter rhizosphaerae]